MFEIRAETDIQAPLKLVWQVVTNLAAYKDWSTMLHYRGGNLELGNRLALRLTLPKGPSYDFSPEVVILEEERHFAWLGVTGFKGIFDGEHHFELSRLTAEKSRLINYERYSGLLSPIFKRLPMMRDAPDGFKAMNEEIRAQAEALFAKK